MEPITNNDNIAEEAPLKESISVVVVPDEVTESHDAEVAAITKKPQMASLRSKFENLNNNQLNTTSSNSKELRSKSPNRISDMINRFS